MARRVLKWVALALVGLMLMVVVAGALIATSQDGSVRLLQYILYSNWDREPNAFEPQGPVGDGVREDGLRVRTNLRYGAQYPNSFLDIWYSDADAKVRRPTIIFIHGGGFFMGSKDMGDPLAGGRDGSSEPVETLANSGFNVVNLDYALSPDFRYPVPLHQLNQAIGFLQDHSARLGLDMSNLVLMGGSAGAQMSAQFGLIVSDPAYAEEVGIRPAIERSNVKGLVLFSPPLRVSGFGWRMNAMMWAYLNTRDLEHSPQARQMDILSHLGPDYPATYITDGNQPDTFPEHAKAMAARLRAKRVDHVFNYYEESEARLGHNYTAELNTVQGRDNLTKAIAFIRQRTSAEAIPAPDTESR